MEINLKSKVKEYVKEYNMTVSAEQRAKDKEQYDGGEKAFKKLTKEHLNDLKYIRKEINNIILIYSPTSLHNIFKDLLVREDQLKPAPSYSYVKQLLEYYMKSPCEVNGYKAEQLYSELENFQSKVVKLIKNNDNLSLVNISMEDINEMGVSIDRLKQGKDLLEIPYAMLSASDKRILAIKFPDRKFYYGFPDENLDHVCECLNVVGPDFIIKNLNSQLVEIQLGLFSNQLNKDRVLSKSRLNKAATKADGFDDATLKGYLQLKAVTRRLTFEDIVTLRSINSSLIVMCANYTPDYETFAFNYIWEGSAENRDLEYLAMVQGDTLKEWIMDESLYIKATKSKNKRTTYTALTQLSMLDMKPTFDVYKYIDVKSVDTTITELSNEEDSKFIKFIYDLGTNLARFRKE